ncbi:MAG: hypothetical protein JO250_14760 [Armatimonadetes bacterium]|nr:hypothetical protein [Armatimonadota bacterium]
MQQGVRVIPVLMILMILTAVLGTDPASAQDTSPGGGSTLAAGRSSGGKTSKAPRHGGYRHYRHYRHYKQYGRYHYGRGYGDSASTNSSGGLSGDNGDSFVRDGRRYYWHYRNGHRYYSSRPDAGDSAGEDMGVGEDLEAPLSREERAQRAARMQKAQARLAALEERVARQRHLHRLHEMAAKPTRKPK